MGFLASMPAAEESASSGLKVVAIVLGNDAGNVLFPRMHLL